VQLVGEARYERERERFGIRMPLARHGRSPSFPNENKQRMSSKDHAGGP
jgi:hypothetical protein